MSNTFVNDIMLEASQYSNRSENPYTITASMVGNPVLQNYLTIIHGTQPVKKIDDTVLGSVFHKGMEEIIKAKILAGGIEGAVITAEENLQHDLSNGWTVSGTADIKILTAGLDSDHRMLRNIRDFKLTKMYAIGKIKQDVPGHNYASQLNILKFLDAKNQEKLSAPETNYELTIDAFAKDPKAINGEESYHPINVPVKHTDVIEAELLSITNLLQQHIESGDIPEACEDVWPRRMRNGTTINTRCTFYCAHGKAGKCPYFNPTTRETVARVSQW